MKGHPLTVGKMIEILSKYPNDLPIWTQPTFGGKMMDVTVVCRHKKSIELLLEDTYSEFVSS